MQTPQLHDDSAPPPSPLAAATPPARAGADADQHQEDTQPRDAAAHCSEDDGGVSPSDGQACSENKGAGSERGSSSSEERDDSVMKTSRWNNSPGTVMKRRLQKQVRPAPTSPKGI
ncbi:hypothetical protein PR002_g3584 [Phytophthora rubi]|uniref:Uncharacterized protein n=1 Tax=Phytophthora rubi TaxID=129364 RepID=A0A6A3NC46_9STRA|nr:hypothetical protein PR002_g3584 [Phytophthora rubi]